MIKVLILQLFQLSLATSILVPDIFLRTLFPHTLSLRSSQNGVASTKFLHTHKIRGKIIVAFPHLQNDQTSSGAHAVVLDSSPEAQRPGREADP
jgi:hypothetical protein